MKISGFTIARNAVLYGYPLEASIRSMLPLVDELVVAVGDCEDGTKELVASIQDPKIKVIFTVWDTELRKGGHILSQQTNLAMAQCTGDWGLYLQADEVLHEHDLPLLRKDMQAHLEDGTEGLLFRYLHFYGSFGVVQDHARKWYNRAVRAVRLGRPVESWGDALGFRMDLGGGRVRDLKNAKTQATVYHYGWVRPPKVMYVKQRNLDSLYHPDGWLDEKYREQERLVRDFYTDRGNLAFFRGSHPAVMAERVAAQDWTFEHGIEGQRPDWVRHLTSGLIYRIEIRLRKLRVRVPALLRRLSGRLKP